MKRSKKYRDIARKVEERMYDVKEAVAFLGEHSVVKFDETLEIHMRLNIDPKKGDQQVRGSVTLPHGTGKDRRVAVITTTLAKEAKDAGADLVGGEEIIADIKSGAFFDGKYDVLVATPDMMPKLAPVARILGPKGMMPNPKSETVTTKVGEVVTSLKKGKVQFKNDPNGNIHQGVGRLSLGVEKLTENVDAFLEAIMRSKPDASKGKFILQISMCTTMGPSLKISQ